MKYRRKERIGWMMFNIYCPQECVEELKRFYIEWKIKNIHRWYEDPVVKKEDK